MDVLSLQTSGTIMTAAGIDDFIYHQFVSSLDVGDKTRETYARAIKHLFDYLRANGITHPREEDIIAFRDETAKTHKPTTAQNRLMAAKAFFKWAARKGLYPNIAEAVKNVKLSAAPKKDNLTAGQVRELLSSVKRDAARGLRDYAIISLMVSAGLRDIEISRANVEDLRTLGGDVVLYVQGKGHTEKADPVHVSQKTETAIREYLRTRSAAGGGEPLFVATSNNSRNKRLSTRSVSKIVKGRLIAAGFNSERLTAHSLRHTAVTLSILAGKPLYEVQKFARHASLNTTMIYNHALEAARNSCSDAIEAAIFP